MRQTTASVLFLLVAALGRSLEHSSALEGALVIILAVGHVSYTKLYFQRNLTYIHFMTWMVDPKLYIGWMLIWHVLEYDYIDKKVLKSKDGKQSKVVEHRVPLCPSHIKEHSVWQMLSSLKMELIGTTLELEHIGDVDAAAPVMDENLALASVEEMLCDAESVWNINKTVLSVAIVYASYITMGDPGLLIGAMLVYVVWTSNTKHSNSGCIIDHREVSKGKKIEAADGVYRISMRVFDVGSHIGVGYLEDGSLHTRYHVTQGNNVSINGVEYAPTYVNKIKDNIVYGGTPKFASVAERDTLLVVLAGPNSNYLVPYKTRAAMDANNNLVFYGNRSIPGSSGSPVFRYTKVELREEERIQEVDKLVLVGTIGWFYNKHLETEPGEVDDRKGVEIVASDPRSSEYSVTIQHGDVVQVFKHPGSGKTRTIAKDLILDGINKYGKCYFTGPTRTVCEEAYKALKEYYPDQICLYTSDANAMERGSVRRPIVIAAHATMLNMVARGASEVHRKGLWIIDESHFCDARTMVLKDLLRHKVRNQAMGALVEMTATGYDIRVGDYVTMEASNYPINDVMMSEENMVKDIISRCKSHKIMVFVTATLGRASTTAQQLANWIEKAGGEYVILNRNTFAAKYTKCMNMEKGVILTTDISECGSNIRPEIVYDFQITSKMVAYGGVVTLEKRAIDKGQRVQRRGRVGRENTNNPTYVSPGLDLPIVDYARVEHQERVIACEALGVDILDPVPGSRHLTEKLTAQQVAVWATSGEGGMQGMPMIYMTTQVDGRIVTESELSKRIAEWARGDRATAKVRDQVIEVQWWDERDRHKLEQFLVKAGKLTDPHPKLGGHWSMYNYLRKILKSRGNQPMIDSFGLIRECEVDAKELEEFIGEGSEEDSVIDDNYDIIS